MMVVCTYGTPAIKKLQKLASSPPPTHFFVHGFVYEPLANDFKVVAIPESRQHGGNNGLQARIHQLMHFLKLSVFLVKSPRMVTMAVVAAEVGRLTDVRRSALRK
ncbi:hypothetical protein PanWU01x14_028500 [Parasponia andersonii]|uniref:Uncharacterized protein n=1 Tax=Parasponia andersonii TaxID=3476 RepID=A0A2P5DVC5_PARAD|nr:hypothetical protein PanWU01x14_028500 [Parasponia andersonii]